LKVTESKPDQVRVKYKNVEVTIYEHPKGYLVIYAMKSMPNFEDEVVMLICDSYPLAQEVIVRV